MGKKRKPTSWQLKVWRMYGIEDTEAERTAEQIAATFRKAVFEAYWIPHRDTLQKNVDSFSHLSPLIRLAEMAHIDRTLFANNDFLKPESPVYQMVRLCAVFCHDLGQYRAPPARIIFEGYKQTLQALSEDTYRGLSNHLYGDDLKLREICRNHGDKNVDILISIFAMRQMKDAVSAWQTVRAPRPSTTSTAIAGSPQSPQDHDPAADLKQTPEIPRLDFTRLLEQLAIAVSILERQYGGKKWFPGSNVTRQYIQDTVYSLLHPITLISTVALHEQFAFSE